MQISVKGRNYRVTDECRELVARKFDKVAKQVSDLAVLEVELCDEPNQTSPDLRKVVLASLHVKGTTLRAKDSSRDMNHTIGMVADELGVQVKRHRDKRRARREARGHTAHAEAPPLP